MREDPFVSQLNFLSWNWHKMIGDSTLADAILDRILNKSIKLELKRGSMRKKVYREQFYFIRRKLTGAFVHHL